MMKYGNVPTVGSDGVVYASKRERNRFESLRMMESAGLITELRTQVKYELVPKQEGERAVTYTIDFQYRDQQGKMHYEDAKGAITQQYIIRRKLMLWFHGIRIEQV
jgi:Protein of unknown function (DUF1064)